jgi:hypothetical protein
MAFSLKSLSEKERKSKSTRPGVVCRKNDEGRETALCYQDCDVTLCVGGSARPITKIF